MLDTLTREQSEHLIKLGYPKWKTQDIKPLDVDLKDWIPNITLTDLLGVLPKQIKAPEKLYRKDDRIYYLSIDWFNSKVFAWYGTHVNDGKWVYLDNYSESDELIEALYYLAEWCLLNDIKL